MKRCQTITNGYWLNKDERRQAALSHHNFMVQCFQVETDNSVDKSRIYGKNVRNISEINTPTQRFVNTDSVSAFLGNYQKDKKICILNFASYKYPGGGFMSGSVAQEEALCHESNLYEILSNEKFENYYLWNNQNLNHSLYLNRAIYTPNVMFVNNKQNRKADVLTCAAPNIAAVRSFYRIDDRLNYRILKDRMQYIANILNDNKVNIFIAGAFGCGVFGQSALDVSRIWKELTYGKDLELIIHPVPGDDINVDSFKKAFD